MNARLFRCDVVDSALCSICESDGETIEHIFLHCPMTRRAWFAFDLGLHISDDSSNSGAFLQQLWKTAYAEVRGKVCRFLYVMWYLQNRWVFDGDPFTCERILNRVLHLVPMVVEPVQSYNNERLWIRRGSDQAQDSSKSTLICLMSVMGELDWAWWSGMVMAW